MTLKPHFTELLKNSLLHKMTTSGILHLSLNYKNFICDSSSHGTYKTKYKENLISHSTQCK